MKPQLYIVANAKRTIVADDENYAIAVAERYATLNRTLVLEFKPRNHSRVVWDTGRERVSSNATGI